MNSRRESVPEVQLRRNFAHPPSPTGEYLYKAAERVYARPAMGASNADGFFELTFAPNLELVSTVRRFVNDFYERLLGGPELTSRLALATHELLENAVKGAADGQTRLRIDLRQEEKMAKVVVRTWNRSSAENVKVLTATIDAMNQADPTQYYLEQMRKTARQTNGSGLGLPRIRAEADMTVGYELEGDLVCISAEARIPQVAG
jgi:hypothetical protein